MIKEEEKILKKNRKRVEEIEYFMRPTSHPIGIKFYRKGSEEPKSIRPLEYPVTICQATTMARVGKRDSEPIMLKKENICCAFSRAVAGFNDWPEDISNGGRSVGIHFAAKEGFRKAFNDLAVMPPGSVEAIVMGPLFNFSMEPDVILLALMPGQVNRFTDGYVWNKGGYIAINFSGMCGVCANTIVKTIIEETCALSFPCIGGRRLGLYQDHELLGGIHVKFFDTWIDGLHNTEAKGYTFPNTFTLPINN
ncbi:hypothetical protein ES705_40561 [subsurface metagenome]